MNFENISLTARLTAYMRQYSDIRFARDVAKHLRANTALTTLLQGQDLRPDELFFYAPILEVRYKSILGLLEAYRIKQVLELASGFSLRGLAMTIDPSIRYIESDLAGLTQEKTAIIADVRARHDLQDHGNFSTAVVNALNLEELQAALASFDPQVPTAIVHEGLAQYFSLQETEAIANNIREIFSQRQGVWITTDFSTKANVASITDQNKRFRSLINSITGRTLYNTIFEHETALEEFFGHLGFTTQCFGQMEFVKHISSAQALHLSDSILEGVTRRTKIWMLQTKDVRVSLGR